MISMELQREVPQYMAIPWLMTWVMARTVSAGREGESGRQGLAGHRAGRRGLVPRRWLVSIPLPSAEEPGCVRRMLSEEQDEGAAA